MGRHGRVVKVRWCGGETLQMGGTRDGKIRSYDGEGVADRDLYEDVGMAIEAVMASPSRWFWTTTKVGRKLAPLKKVACVDSLMEHAPVVIQFPDGWAHG